MTIDKGKKAAPEVVNEDEHPRPQTDMAALAKLKTLFEGGVTTAGNASGVNDGAAALYVGSLEAGEKAGKKPIARIVAISRARPATAANGGAIAVGHPLGCSGARIALSAARQLQRSGGRYALVSLCIGVGQGMAVVLERV